ncbi:MAG: hypothetical protein IJX76_01010 [Clostridia bacterium]|nr:hypothetical protein [Clostridia bacterium]
MEEKIYKLLDHIKKNGDNCPDYEKIKELTPKILLDWKDINNFLYCLPECDYDILALEAVLLAVDGDVRCGREGNGLAKAVLFHLYHDGEYEVLIHDRVVRINAPELKSRERYDAFLESDCPDHYMHVGTEDIIPDVYTLDAHDYMMLYLFGTNFGEDVYRYPVETVEDLSAKNFEQAKQYLPKYVDYVLKIEETPDYSMDFILASMIFNGYTEKEVNEFALRWIDIAQKEVTPCYASMYLYLFGQYDFEYQETGSVKAPERKDFERALSHIPTYASHLCEVYENRGDPGPNDHDPDTELNKLIHKMREQSYEASEIERFATLWMQEMMKRGKAFYSLMYMRLFGEHFGGTRVNIDGIKNFNAALALIPDYLEYIFAYKDFGDELYYVFDPDQQLYHLICAMREHAYGEDDVCIFVTHWMNAAIASGHPYNSPMYVYLLGQFVFRQEGMTMDIGEDKKSFAAALAFIPRWIEFLTDDSMMYHKGYSVSDIFDLLARMREAGYEKEQSEELLSAFLEELASVSSYEVHSLKRDLANYAQKEPWLREYLPVFEIVYKD